MSKKEVQGLEEMLCQNSHTIWQNWPSEALLFSVRQSWIKVDLMPEWKKKANITSFIILLSHNWWSSIRIHGDHEWTASVKSRLRSGLWLRDIDVMLCSVASFFSPQARCPRFPADCIKFPLQHSACVFLQLFYPLPSQAPAAERHPRDTASTTPHLGDVVTYQSTEASSSWHHHLLFLKFWEWLSLCHIAIKLQLVKPRGQLTDCLSNGCTSDDLGVSY